MCSRKHRWIFSFWSFCSMVFLFLCSYHTLLLLQPCNMICLNNLMVYVGFFLLLSCSSQLSWPIHGPLYFHIQFLKELLVLTGIASQLQTSIRNEVFLFKSSFTSYNRAFGFSSKLSYTFFFKVNSWIFYGFSVLFFCK